MYEQHPSFDEPPNETVIWRYMNLSKFAAMLFNSSLFFSRIDQLGDTTEGTIQLKLLMSQDRAVKSDREEDNPVTYKTNLDVYLGSIEMMRLSTFVNCWFMSEHESMLMWRQYVNDEGIAIKSTFGKLKTASSDSKQHKINLGMIKYLDYHHEMIPMENLFNLFTHKRVFFSDEREVRAVISDMFGENMEISSQQIWKEVEKGRFPELKPYIDYLKWNKAIVLSPDEKDKQDKIITLVWEARNSITRENTGNGINVEVNLIELIDSVYVAPNSPEWFRDTVQELISRTLNCGIEVRISGADLPI